MRNIISALPISWLVGAFPTTAVTTTAFISSPSRIHANNQPRFLLRQQLRLYSSAPSDTADQSYESPVSNELDKIKSDLLNYCESPAADNSIVLTKISAVEELGEQYGIGQGSSNSGLLSGEWELIYAPEDVTRCVWGYFVFNLLLF